MEPAIGFQQSDAQTVSFEAGVRISDAGNWTFRVVSIMSGIKTNIGSPSRPVLFVDPASSSLLGILASSWRTIASSSIAILVIINLVVFSAARYSATAWRLATDNFWGTKALVPLMLLLRLSRFAQLWLLDLYIQQRRKALPDKPGPFLPMLLTGPRGDIINSGIVSLRLAAARHLWLHGGTGMGKTATFQHLAQTHFGGTQTTAFGIFRRDGYVLIPIEARRFPVAALYENHSSAWVVACIRSVLSETGLSFANEGLLRSILYKGTLAIAIDGRHKIFRTLSITGKKYVFYRKDISVSTSWWEVANAWFFPDHR
jgi:hypothetical protein